MSLVGSTLAATVLIHGGSRKLVRPAPIAETLGRLGITSNYLPLVGRALALYELGLAAAILGVGGLPTAFAVVVTGGAFCAVGLWVMVSGRDVECNCLGSRNKPSKLGMRQVAACPLWVLAAAAAYESEALSVEARLLAASIGLLVVVSFAGSELMTSLAPWRTMRLAQQTPTDAAWGRF